MKTENPAEDCECGCGYDREAHLIAENNRKPATEMAEGGNKMKIETKHTSGEWCWYSKTDAPSGLSGDDGVLRSFIGTKSEHLPPNALVALPMNGKEGQANACLIAAAPELLESAKVALKSMLCQRDLNHAGGLAIEKLKSAITKAEGSK